MTQEIAWLTTVLVVASIGAAFLMVVRNSAQREDYAPVQKAAYSFRGKFFWALVVVTAGVTMFTLVDLPYSAAARQQGEVLNVHVTGHQWYWEMDKDQASVGQPVVFNVGSGDVNHGFAVYDDDMNVLAQTQAMPGYINKVAYTFQEPGTYHILCLEYCGMSHTRMKTEFHVAAR